MKRKDEYRKIYETSFSDDSVWIDWMMRRVYDNSEVMLIEDESGAKAASGLLLRSYGWRYFGADLDMSYIYGACTLPRCRAHGYMRRLIDESLRRSVERGDAICTLIPATRSLYDYYSAFGFSPAVYIDRERYTAVHHFENPGLYHDAEAVYDEFHRLEMESDNTVSHSADDFADILDDLHFDGGDAFAVASASDGRISAMAFAVPHRDSIHVKALFADSVEAKNAVLSLVRERYGELMTVVDCFVDGRRRSLERHGMVRLLDVFQILNAMAASDPLLNCTVRVRDSRIAGNSDIFTVSDGICRRGGTTANLDVGIDTLASIIGSSESVGRLMGLRSTHFPLPLMLD
ncbi:MAG: GNAT family N-acetyltransferase [Muribaculaceae bacterium]|nr:GNAT family N-acetyltransferase [Muribaculaceae bacterium]